MARTSSISPTSPCRFCVCLCALERTSARAAVRDLVRRIRAPRTRTPPNHKQAAGQPVGRAIERCGLQGIAEHAFSCGASSATWRACARLRRPCSLKSPHI